MRIKIDRADRYFSLYVRELADNTCERCGNQGESLQNSHYFGRANEATRFEPNNCMCLCYACHVRWGSTDREDYREAMIKKLGEKGYKNLVIQSNSYKKKDRKMESIKWREAYKALCKEKGVTPKKL